MIANFIMYAVPELDAAHQRYWQLIRTGLADRQVAAPATLSQGLGEFESWENADLVLSQTCGMPYRLWLHERVTLVGTPDYGVQGCAPGYYRSAIVVRANDRRSRIQDFKEATFAYNKTYSQSGWAAAYQYCQPHGFWFGRRLRAGRHLHAAQAVADGRADIAALDAVSWRLIQAYSSSANALRVLDWTTPTPGLPYITARAGQADVIFSAVQQAIEQLSEHDRALLMIRRLVPIASTAYLAVANPPLDEVMAERP